MAMKRHRRLGLSATEIVFAVALLVILGITMVPDALGRLAAAHDARRIEDAQHIQDAIEAYHKDHGVWPPAHENPEYGGWDVSQDGDFIPDLIKEGYLTEVPKDPINDETYQYRYYVYPKGSGGCKGDASFYVLGVRAFETNDYALKNKGQFKCASRNWGDEFAFVTGGGASETSTTNLGVPGG